MQNKRIAGLLLATAVAFLPAFQLHQSKALPVQENTDAPRFHIHDGSRLICFRTLLDDVQLDNFGNLVIDRNYFEPFESVRHGVKPGRLDVGVTTRALGRKLKNPLIVTFAVRISVNDESKHIAVLRLGDIELSEKKTQKDFNVDLEEVSQFLGLGKPKNNRYPGLCIEIGCFYNGIGESHCNTFHSVAKHTSE